MAQRPTTNPERRWIVVGPDGRYVTLGRDTDATQAEIVRINDDFRSQGLSGWQAILRGNPHVGPLPSLMEVRSLGDLTSSFTDAEEACLSLIKTSREER